MAPNRITQGGATLAALFLIALVAGCGGGSSSTSTVPPASTSTALGAKAGEGETATVPPEKAADAAALNKVLARQEAAVAAFTQVIPSLPPRLARMASYFRAQEQEHVDAVVKAMRGLGIPAEPTPAPIDLGEAGNDRERLLFLYEVEGATIDEELSAISTLEASWPRSLLASTVANQAQHLTLLRQALGAGPLASVPEPFENGTAEPPE